jgi:predicted glycogen debranching enzyme
MHYISFDHNQLVNLRYSLNKEIIRSNRYGGYSSTTLNQCPTRKYHGLLIVPQPQIDGDKHVLLSTLDETIQTSRGEFNLGIHQYPMHYYPKGHKYLSSFEAEPIPKWKYRAGDIILYKSMLLKSYDQKLLVKYRVGSAPEKFKLRLTSFLAFRNYHHLSKANVFINTRYRTVNNGVAIKPYEGYDELFIQLSRKNKYVHAPDWNYNVEYSQEKERGYPYQEDLWVPGYFEVELKEGDVLYFTAGTSESAPGNMKAAFSSELKTRIPRSNFMNCMRNAAQQFIEDREEGKFVCAGLHWFGNWGRDTFISIPGLALTEGDFNTAHDILQTSLRDFNNGLFPNIGTGNNASYNSVDASLWFVWAVQKLLEAEEKPKKIVNRYKSALKEIFYAYRDGKNDGIYMDDDGLIHAEIEGKALTWMDAVTSDGPVTQRPGKPVEISALWYNAVCFMLNDVSDSNSDWANDLQDVKKKIEDSFVNRYWISDSEYLADYVYGEYRDHAMRPNQIIACSLPYKLLSPEQCASVLWHVKNELLTPRGLRSLSPKNPNYKGVYEGDQQKRDETYHQGTVWLWMMGHLAESWLHTYGEERSDWIEEWIEGLEPHLFEAGISTLSEIFDGDPPHTARGSISQAWSVAEVLRITRMLEGLKELR